MFLGECRLAAPGGRVARLPVLEMSRARRDLLDWEISEGSRHRRGHPTSPGSGGASPYLSLATVSAMIKDRERDDSRAKRAQFLGSPSLTTDN
jgi:hypothetical protein